MELMFNELSEQPICRDRYEAAERMQTLVKAFSIAKKHGFKNIRSVKYVHEIQLAEDYSLKDWLFDRNVSQILRGNLISVLVHPFIDSENTLAEERFILSDYYFEDEGSGIQRQECYGLSAALLQESLAISFTSLPVWLECVLRVIVCTAANESIEEVLNVSSVSSFDHSAINQFIENSGEIELIETALSPEEKEIKISSHHGESELRSFCDRIRYSPYVEIMRSTNWGGNNFIRKATRDGIIEIVLVKTLRKYALWIQTTGRNLRETEAIAEILEEKYF